jgi:hypothetical protein
MKGGEMPGSNKFIPRGGPDSGPPKNLWEVLERGNVDTYPLHTALWLFKNAQGGPGPFRHLPGPEFGYRVRDSKVRSTSPNNGSVTLQALAWFLCQPAYGQGHLAAGPTAQVYGSLANGFLVPPMIFPTSPAESSEEVRDLLAQATFPLAELPVMSRRHVESFFALMFMKSSCIFGLQESQLIRRACAANRCKTVPDDIERDLQYAIDRASRAFVMPTREDWEYDQRRNGTYIKTIRCRRLVQISSARSKEVCEEAPRYVSEETSPYSPPYWGLPIFDVKPLYAEALRLMKSVPDDLKWCPDLYFMTSEDWRRFYGIRRARMYPDGQSAECSCPKNADYRAAWDWVEFFYGLRVRVALHPSDKDHKGRVSPPRTELH